MRKQNLTNAINTILETNEEVTIRVKDNSYLFLERAGQLVFDALHKEGYKICTYDGNVQVLEELGYDLPNKEMDAPKNKLLMLHESLCDAEKQYIRLTVTEGCSQRYKEWRNKVLELRKDLEELNSGLLKKSKKYTIKDLRDGKVGIKYARDYERLVKVLRKAFPDNIEYLLSNKNYLEEGDCFYIDPDFGYCWDSYRNQTINNLITENEIQL